MLNPEAGGPVTDVFSRKKRSEVMSRIRSRGTALEEILYGLVRSSLDGRWRIDRNVKSLPGCPDIVIPRLHLAVFADGCFYHGCCRHGHIPKSNRGYWLPKLARNCARDRSNRRKLRGMGYSVWAVWEHALEGRRLVKTAASLHRRLSLLKERPVSR